MQVRLVSFQVSRYNHPTKLEFSATFMRLVSFHVAHYSSPKPTSCSLLYMPQVCLWCAQIFSNFTTKNSEPLDSL